MILTVFSLLLKFDTYIINNLKFIKKKRKGLEVEFIRYWLLQMTRHVLFASQETVKNHDRQVQFKILIFKYVTTKTQINVLSYQHLNINKILL